MSEEVADVDAPWPRAQAPGSGRPGARTIGAVTTSERPDAPADGVAVAQLTVEGMHCGSCVALIEETLAEREGVRAASVDLDAARAVVQYDPSTLDVEEIRAAIAEAGYSASPVS